MSSPLTHPGGLFDQVSAYLASGGYVMPPLVIITLVLWYALGARWALLQRGSQKNVRVLLRKYSQGRGKAPEGIVDQAIVHGLRLRDEGQAPLRRYLDDAFADYEARIKRFASTVTTMVAIAPLLGLLGTVAGMIETFDSLGDMSLFSQSGGIAGGIATALFTTQMGLVVAVPGVICKALLDRRQHQIEIDLAQIKDLLTSNTHLDQDA
ncbi:MotA/TolQ/ExbB proton channel family protein [Pseudomarimonas salicorniae]|uniref:MotA/TolQ/ExbB proton channel family protein n=1 Tax=Pseudomarimonas salicorniae TaxID=2933270 RepID=A0ABT0GDL5_9GAMM|nr:MotA/TolQ/ExbB proton channel family protein [Lysobacter sp. CAU 1642]MCK7592528.1 MotA/TolQ/ExbB proton channel family protein [Lysobacter sp. CAU 1642]